MDGIPFVKIAEMARPRKCDYYGENNLLEMRED